MYKRKKLIAIDYSVWSHKLFSEIELLGTKSSTNSANDSANLLSYLKQSYWWPGGENDPAAEAVIKLIETIDWSSYNNSIIYLASDMSDYLQELLDLNNPNAMRIRNSEFAAIVSIGYAC